MGTDLLPQSSDISEKWIWMMNYCKTNGLPPAQKWAWDLAENAYNNKTLT